MATVTTVIEKASLGDYSQSVSANRPWSVSASTSTPVLDLELESRTSSTVKNTPWTYSGAVDPPTEVGNYIPQLRNVLNNFMQILSNESVTIF